MQSSFFREKRDKVVVGQASDVARKALSSWRTTAVSITHSEHNLLASRLKAKKRFSLSDPLNSPDRSRLLGITLR